jgi:formylglycine-generating enzyme required for sulfatase activity
MEAHQNYRGEGGEPQIIDDSEHNLVVDYRSGRILHGGSFVTRPSLIRSSYRFNALPDDEFTDIGFRLARTLSSVPATAANATAANESEIGGTTE